MIIKQIIAYFVLYNMNYFFISFKFLHNDFVNNINIYIYIFMN